MVVISNDHPKILSNQPIINELIRNISEWIGTLTSSAVTMLDDDGMKIDENHNEQGLFAIRAKQDFDKKKVI